MTRSKHGESRGLIGKKCMCNKHLDCADEFCACICHRDRVLVKQLREQYLKRAHQARLEEEAA